MATMVDKGRPRERDAAWARIRSWLSPEARAEFDAASRLFPGLGRENGREKRTRSAGLGRQEGATIMGTSEPRQAELWSFDGPPVNGPAGTFHQHASIGDLFVDTSAKRLYVCTEVLQSSGFTGAGQDHLQGAAASITWEPLQ